MEPPLGQASFFILCLDFAQEQVCLPPLSLLGVPPAARSGLTYLGASFGAFRALQLDNMGKKPYIDRVIEARAKKLSEAHSQYHSGIVQDFGISRGLK